MTRRLETREAALLGLLLLAGAAFLLAPWPLYGKLWAIAYGICPQRASHSYFVSGSQLPLEARMTGIFAGFFLSILYLFLIGRDRASRFPPQGVLFTLLGFLATMGGDGVNAALYDFGLPYLYLPQNGLRLVTGFWGGVAMALLTWPAFSFTFWRDPAPSAVLKNFRELGTALLAPALAAAAILGGVELLFYPLATISVLGILAFLGLLNSLVLITLLHREGRGEMWWDFLVPGGGGLLLSLLELGLLSVLKFWILGPNPLA